MSKIILKERSSVMGKKNEEEIQLDDLQMDILLSHAVILRTHHGDG